MDGNTLVSTILPKSKGKELTIEEGEEERHIILIRLVKLTNVFLYFYSKKIKKNSYLIYFTNILYSVRLCISVSGV